MLLDWLTHAARHGKDARGILFRRTMPELEDMLDKARELMPRMGWKYFEQKKTWVGPTGAVLKMRYLERDQHADRYMGHEYSWVGIDEAGSWPSPYPIDKLRATLRSAAGIKPRMVLTANPGGVGHNWLKARYIDPAQPLKIQTEINGESTWTLTYIPAKFSDNLLLQRADPGYIDRATAKLPEWLAKAWRDGDWNIVAGGMFDDVWSDRNEIEPFPIPKGWRIDRGFDWGSSRPFAVGWFAESDGTAAKLRDETEWCPPKGTVIMVAEWYGSTGKPNEGVRMTAKEIGRGVIERDKFIGHVYPGPADSAIYNTQDNHCIADEMAIVGCRWEASDKGPGSRVTGWQTLRDRLTSANIQPMEDPGFFVFKTCRHTIRTVPALPRDSKNIEDVNTDAEDHIGDMIRYRLATHRYESNIEPLRL